MALIQCSGCGQMVSDKASNCPHCGAPVGKSRGGEGTATDKVRQNNGEVNKDALYTSPGTESSGLKRILIGFVTFFILDVVLNVTLLGFIIGNLKCEPSIEGYVALIDFIVALLLTRYITLRRRKKNREKTKVAKEVANAKNKREESIILSMTTVLLITVVLLIVGTCKGGSKKSENKAEVETPSSIQRKIKSVTTVEEAAEAINNTVWHYTEVLDDSEIGFWIKVEFKDGRYTHYAAHPSDGKWTKKGEGMFEIKEGRYSNTGERYIAVEWQGGDALGSSTDVYNFSMVFENLQLGASLSHPFSPAEAKKYYATMEYGDYEWD